MLEPSLSIIIPTYNEEEVIAETVLNINRLLNRTKIPFEILVVDDSSTDKTQQIVTELSSLYPVRLLTRTKDPGLSQSVVYGFSRAQGNVIVVTDADGSHDATRIPQMYREIADNDIDIVIGSRYCKDGAIIDWPIKRRAISWGATFLSRLLFPCITDPVSGFFAVKKELVIHAPLKPEGYKILLEILGKSYWHSVKELPYAFTNRQHGVSKLKTGTMIIFLKQFLSIARFPGRARKEVERIKKFALVGVSGIFVNMVALAALKESGVPLIGASFVAIELAIISNFLLNDKWTFNGEDNKKSWLHRLFSFNGISVGGMIINVAVLGGLSIFNVWYIIGNLCGIVCAFGWNFIANRRMTWGKINF